MNTHTTTNRFIQFALTALLLCASAGALAEKVNLNTAGLEALQYLPGIGASKAADIIRVREEIGGFKTLEDVLTVPGVGERTLFYFRDYSVVKGGVSVLTEEMEANPPLLIPSKNNDHAKSDDPS